MARKAVKSGVRRSPARKAASIEAGSYTVTLPRGSRGEVARVVIDQVLDRLASVPERDATRLLDEFRAADEPGERVMSWLRVEDRDSVDAKQVLEDAFRRGDQRRAQILRDPSMLTGEAAARRLGVARETINQRARHGRLLALEFAKRGKRYPEWQFEETIAGAPLEAALSVLRARDPWERYRFFTQKQPGLGGRTPIEALRQGDRDAARRAAEDWTAGDQGGG